MPTALQLAEGNPVLLDTVRRARQLLNRRALVGAAASAIPIPGLDWAVDAALLSRLVPAINAEFGLAPEQLDRLPARQREQVQKAVALVGTVLVGRFITRDLVIRMAQTAGKRLTARQAAKYVPIAGQAVAAIMGYTALRYLGEEHIKDCVRVARGAAATGDDAGLTGVAPAAASRGKATGTPSRRRRARCQVSSPRP